MTLKIEKLSHEGRGIGFTAEGKPVFIPKTVPGDIVEFKIQKEKSKIIEAIASQIIKSSPDRIEAFCPYFDLCGGCDFQMVSYNKQLEFKEAIFKDILTRIGGILDLSMIKPAIGMPGTLPKYYRNKIRFAFMEENGQIEFSRHNRSNPQADIPVNFCYLQSERSNQLLDILKQWASKNKLTIFNPKTLEGWLKYVLIREGKKTNNLMIDITTTKGRIDNQLRDNFLKRLKIAKIIRDPDDFLFSLYQTETSGISNSRIKLNHLHGSKFIKDQIGHCIFQISHDSFFQTNSIMVEIIYNTVLKFLEPKPTGIVWDLYCGTGAIGIYIAKQVDRVIGIENCQPAIDDAKINAELNQLNNIDFICGSVENTIQNSKFIIPNSIILDPPRAGLDQKTRDFLKTSKAKKIIYVSCSPQTLARDLKDLTADQQYQIRKIQPIDSFPHTRHLESVTLIERT